MLHNYLIITWRNLKNNMLFSVMNVIGLSVGIACCFIMFLLAYQEYTYDSYHQHAKQIYRIVNRQPAESKLFYVAMTPGVLAPEVARTFPEVRSATRVGFVNASLRTTRNPEAMQERLMAVDSTYFHIFDLPFKIAPVEEPLSPDGILISEKAAVRLFGKENPINEVITLGEDVHLKVTGVFKDITLHSHLLTDFIIPFTWIEKWEPISTTWTANSYYSYVLMPENFDREAFNKKLNDHIHLFTPESWKSYDFFLQPMREIMLSAGYSGNPRGAIGTIVIKSFVIVALVILALTVFNYVNLATARSVKRSIEVGVRKVVGAQRTQLMWQFLGEAFVLCVLGFALGILWADLGLQFFNYYTGFQLRLATFFTDFEIILWMTGALLLLTLMTGGYPAFFLSRFIPAAVLKGHRSTDSGRRMRKGLVVFQFALTSMLLTLVVIVHKQTNYMRSLDYGFNTDQLIIFSADRNNDISLESFKAELVKTPGVDRVANASHFPGFRINITNIWANGKSESESIRIGWIFADHDYIPVLDLTLLAGRNFLASGHDKRTGVIINETAANALGWSAEEAVGKRIAGFIFSDSLPGEIIGVLKDYYAGSIKKEIPPLVIGYSTDETGYLVRLQSSGIFKTREGIDNTGEKFTHGKKFESTFMEDAIEESFGLEKKSEEVLIFFTFLATLIGCSGLYALATYEGEQRTKELGIRKIMGATSPQLLLLLSRDFLKLIAISLMVALPLAYFLGSLWLRPYANRISWTADIFTISSGLILAFGWLTILWQAIKSSRLNPAEALRYE